MRRNWLGFLRMVLCFLLLSGNAKGAEVSITATVPLQVVEITNLSYGPVPYDPTVGQVAISFSLSKPASTSVLIRDMFDSPVTSLGPFSGSAGPNVLFWDGENFAGKLVAPAWYFYTVSATDGVTSDEETGVIAVDYGEPLTIEMLASERRFHPSGKNEVRLSILLSRQAVVSVIIFENDSGQAVRSAPLTLWPQGRNVFIWDGRDDQGRIVSPGKYTCAISGEDSGGNSDSASGTISVF